MFKKINTEHELLEILKVISEEAVKKSKKVLSEASDAAQTRYQSQVKASENFYGVALSEQEEPEPADEPAPEVPDEETTDDAAAEEPDPEAEGIDPETFGVSFDSVIKDINNLRAGRSTKDKDIKDQLLGYYDRLDDGERKILHLFLSELSKILQGALSATDAQDPSEPPFNADISFGEEDEAQAEDETAQADEPSDEPGSEEDTAPPIKVNETQNLNEIRMKVKRLMKRI